MPLFPFQVSPTARPPSYTSTSSLSLLTSVPSPSSSRPTFVLPLRPFFRLTRLTSFCAFDSQEFLVGGGLTTSLTLADPPAALTIFAVNVYLVQTTGITSTKPPFRSAESKGTKQFIARQGEKDGYADSGFAERARRKGKVLFEGGKTKLKPGEMWTWEKFGRLVSRDASSFSLTFWSRRMAADSQRFFCVAL